MQVRTDKNGQPTGWIKEFSTAGMLVYTARKDSNNLDIEFIKIEKRYENNAMFNCSVFFPERKKQLFYTELPSHLNRIIKLKEAKLFDNFNIRTDNQNAQVIKAIIETLNTFLPFDDCDRQALFDFIGMPGMKLVNSRAANPCTIL